MTILALDTSHGATHGTLKVGDSVLSETNSVQAKQAECLPEITNSLLSKAGKEISDLEAIAVTVGPGSFTGIRIALAYAKGIAIAHSIPVIGVTNFEVYQSLSNADEPYLIALKAMRDQLYCQFVGNNEKPALVNIDEVDEFCSASPSIILTDDADYFTHPKIETKELDFSIEAVLDIAAGKMADPASYPAEPLYIRPPDAKKQGEA